MKKCPKCGYNKFIVGITITQSWIVDKNGCFESIYTDCDDVLDEPSDNSIWECAKCHYEAEGSEFNVKG